MKNFHKKGFTLVELIVVITILAILWTIAFISLQWYSKSARDSKRVSDIWNIKTSLALFNTRTWRYPEPDQITNIVYSWTTVWTQWIIWEDTTRQLRELWKIPLDPLLQEEYTYSLLSTKDEYEIWSIMENEQMWFIKKTFAEEQKYYTLITWNYNWKVAKAYSWSDIYVFWIPSIIWSDLSSNDLIEIINKKALSFNWYQNIPDNFKWNNIAMTWSFDFWWENFDILIYSWSLDLLSSSWTLLENFWDRIQEIYWISILVEHNDYKDLKDLDTSNSSELNNVIWTIINNNLWWKVENISNNNSWICKLNSFELNNLNSFFWDFWYNGDEEFWCTLDDLEVNWERLDWIVPREVSELIALQNLDLWDNNFSINKLKFSNLTNLTNLNLSKLNLSSIPESIIHLNNLNELYLNNNQLYILPDDIISLNNLYELDLSWNELLWQLSSNFSQSSTIKTEKNVTPTNKNISIVWNWDKLIISSENWATCSLNSTETESLNTYFSWKWYNWNDNYWCNLTSINLSNQTLSQTLPEEILNLKKLTTLNLKNTWINKLPENLSLLTNLISLDLSENNDLWDLNYNFTKDYIWEEKVWTYITPTSKNIWIIWNKRYIRVWLYIPR